MTVATQPTGQDNTASPSSDAQAAPATLLTAQADDNVAGTPADATKQAPDAPAEDGKTDAPPDDATKADTDKADDADKAKAEGAPEKYELKAPEGFPQLDAVLVDKFEPLARELNLSNEQANKLVDTMLPQVVARMNEQARDGWVNTIESWQQQVVADKEIGGEQLQSNLQHARRALDKFATPELRSLIEHPGTDPKGMGLGNHPEVMRLFVRLGKAMADDSFVSGNGNPANAPKDAAEILYGNKS